MYTTCGSVRGCCGHKHGSILAAEKCLARDQKGCRSQGGYSDREVETIGVYHYLHHEARRRKMAKCL